MSYSYVDCGAKPCLRTDGLRYAIEMKKPDLYRTRPCMLSVFSRKDSPAALLSRQMYSNILFQARQGEAEKRTSYAFTFFSEIFPFFFFCPVIHYSS